MTLDPAGLNWKVDFSSATIVIFWWGWHKQFWCTTATCVIQLCRNPNSCLVLQDNCMPTWMIWKAKVCDKQCAEQAVQKWNPTTGLSFLQDCTYCIFYSVCAVSSFEVILATPVFYCAIRFRSPGATFARSINVFMLLRCKFVLITKSWNLLAWVDQIAAL